LDQFLRGCSGVHVNFSLDHSSKVETSYLLVGVETDSFEPFISHVR
jgi:hypothetical protein